MARSAIRVVNLGKRYQLGQMMSGRTLRDAIAKLVKTPFQARTGKVLDGGNPSRNSHGPDCVWALRNLSFQLDEGEVLGIIGPNGAGKTTLLKVLSRITEPTEGTALIRGRVGSLLEVGTGFHQELTGRENIYLNGAILGMKKVEIEAKFDEIVAFSELNEFMDTPVKRYSSGMRVRLAFAVAAHLEPEILLVDEVLSVGDAAFQRKSLGKMGEVSQEGRTVLFVSHNMAAVENLCQSAFLLDQGNVTASGVPSDVIAEYLEKASRSSPGTQLQGQSRRGNGKLRFTSFSTIMNGRDVGAVRCGSSTKFVLRYVGQPPLRNVKIDVGLYSLFGERVLHLSNETTGGLFTDLPARGIVSCCFDKLPLLPGIYRVNLYCTVNGILADWIIDAAQVQVVEGDYFGTGKLPPEGFGSVAVPHTWEKNFDE